MSDHLTKNQIEGYGCRALSPAELLLVSDHLGFCAACRRQVKRGLDGDATYLALKAEIFGESILSSSLAGQMHLTFEQIAGWVDATLIGDELQAIKDHLSYCRHCELVIEDLGAFKDAVVFEVPDRVSPVAAKTEKGWHRLIATLTTIWPKPLVLGPSMAALLMAAIGWLAWQAFTMKENKETNSTVTSSSLPKVPVPDSHGSDQKGAAVTIIARLNDGYGDVTLDEEGKLSGVDHLPVAYRQMIKSALTDQDLVRSPLLEELIEQGSIPRGGSYVTTDNFSVIEPIKMATLSDRPTFRWSQLAGATGYIVEIYNEEFDLVATSPQVADHQWRIPQSLKRGGIYAWQVKAIKDGRESVSPQPPAPQAKFRVLDEINAKELARARRAYASSHLTLGLLYTKGGLLDEAEQEFRALQKANPDSAIADRLLKQVRSRMK